MILDLPPVPGYRMYRRHQDDDWQREPCEPGAECWESLPRLYPAHPHADPPGTVIEAGTLFRERWLVTSDGEWDPERCWDVPGTTWVSQSTGRALTAEERIQLAAGGEAWVVHAPWLAQPCVSPPS